MSALDGLAFGFGVALQPGNLLAALMGAVLGTAVGVLPGLGPTATMAMLLPITLLLSPTTAIIMLAGIYYGAMYGGSTTSILMNLPGEASSLVTAIDGYQMTRKGRAGAALAVAAVGSWVAGTLGVVALMLFAPPLAQFALAFGPPELFALGLVGLLTLSRLGGGSFWRSLVVVGLGLMLGTVGMQPLSGTMRFTFGFVELAQSINIVPVAMGLYGLAELLRIVEKSIGFPRIATLKLRELFPSPEEWRRAFAPILRGTGIGFVIGLLPGPAGIISTFASYNVERRLSRHPEEFGHGAIEGVAGPESANNAAVAGHLVPLLSLGIPFGSDTAMLLAALLIQGIRPGPLLIQEHADIFWGLVASMYVGNVALLVLNLPLVGIWVRMLRIPQAIQIALIVLLVLVGAYSLNNSMLDVLVTVVMGAVGYLMTKFDFNAAPLVLALVLGPMMETAFQQSLMMSEGGLLVFVLRPISGTLIALAFLVIAGPLVLRSLRRGAGDAELQPRVLVEALEHESRDG